MRYRWLGKTGFKVSEIGFGAWAIGGDAWGPQDDQDSRLALHKSLDMGCNFIDTAWAYGEGHSERLIGSVIRERNEHPVIATKVPPKNWLWDQNRPETPLSDVFTPEWITSKAEESLRNLGVECLDVLQLHTWRPEWNSQSEPVLAAVARLKREGKIRAFGISLRDKAPEEANELIRLQQVDTLQIFFNLFYQDPAWKVFPLAQKYNVGVIARVPLAFGALSGRFNAKIRFTGSDHRQWLYKGDGLQTTLKKVEKLKFLASKTMPLAESALKWTLAYPAVSTAIPGIRNLKQAFLNCVAGDGPVLPASAVRKAEKLYKINFGLPVKTIESDEEISAVLMSGVRVVGKKLQKGKSTTKTLPRKKKSKTAKKNRSTRKSKKKKK
jgi:aryl-alcohol dehydrogenase-like predicted oxidoreductase